MTLINWISLTGTLTDWFLPFNEPAVLPISFRFLFLQWEIEIMGTRAGNELPVSLGPALEMQGEELGF